MAGVITAVALSPNPANTGDSLLIRVTVDFQPLIFNQLEATALTFNALDGTKWDDIDT